MGLITDNYLLALFCPNEIKKKSGVSQQEINIANDSLEQIPELGVVIPEAVPKQRKGTVRDEEEKNRYKEVKKIRSMYTNDFLISSDELPKSMEIDKLQRREELKEYENELSQATSRLNESPSFETSFDKDFFSTRKKRMKKTYPMHNFYPISQTEINSISFLNPLSFSTPFRKPISSPFYSTLWI